MDEGTRATDERLARAAVTPREREVFWEVADRLRNREIAERLHLSERTVESHVAALLRKLGGSGRDDLVRLAAEGRARAGAARLPTIATSLVGRDDDLVRLAGLAAHHRVVTLVGPAGAGKTRLALRLAASLPELPPATFVDLARVPVGGDVDAAFLSALGGSDGDAGTAGAVRAAVVDRAHWLVVDNAEHVLASLRPRLVDLLGAAPHLRVLATSRSPLAVPGEVVHEVRPLALPPVVADAEAVVAAPAGRLFADRAAMALPGFEVTDATARDVATLCHRLDGLPLAIELAASRVRTFSPHELVVLLDDRAALLATPGPATEARHGTLEAAVAWSHELLDDDERRLFARLAVFPGEFTYDDARVVAGGPPFEGGTFPATFARLFDRSLVAALRYGEVTRYRLLEVVRAFAVGLLAASDEAESLGRAHAEHHVRLAIETAQRARGPGQLEALHAFDQRWADLQAAMAWALGHGAEALAWQLLEGVGTAWETLGMRPGLLDWLEDLLDRGLPEGADGDRARAAAGCMLVYRDPDRAAEHACAMDEPAADAGGLRPLPSLVLGWATLYRDHAAAVPHLVAARDRFRASGDVWHEALALQGLGLATADLRESLDHLVASVRLFASLGDEVKQANALSHLVARRLDAWPDPEQVRAAEADLAVARELARRTGSVHERRHVDLYGARLDQLRGDHHRAEPALRDALPVFRELGDRRCVSRCLLGLGRAALARGDVEAGRRLLAEARDEAGAVGAATVAADARRLLDETAARTTAG